MLCRTGIKMEQMFSDEVFLSDGMNADQHYIDVTDFV